MKYIDLGHLFPKQDQPLSSPITFIPHLQTLYFNNMEYPMFYQCQGTNLAPEEMGNSTYVSSPAFIGKISSLRNKLPHGALILTKISNIV